MLRRLALMLALAASLVLPACHWIASYDQARAADAQDGGLADGETAPPPDDGAMDGAADGAWHDFSLDGVPRDGAAVEGLPDVPLLEGLPPPDLSVPADGPPDALPQGEAAPPLDLPVAVDALVQIPPTSWALSVGSAYADKGQGVAVDAYGNVYVVGQIGPSAHFAGQPLSANTSYDAVLASANAEGSPRWAKALGGIDADNGRAVAVDSAGNVYVTGSIQGNVDLGGGEVQSMHQLDIFLASYTPTGAHRWSKIYGGLNADIGRALAVNAAGEVTLVGSINSAVSFGPNPVTYEGGTDAFVARFDGANGNHLWSSAFGGTSEDIAYGVATDSAGNTTIVGTHQLTFGFGNCSLPMTSGKRIFVTSVDDASVSCAWVKGFGNTTSQHAAYAVATDAAGEIYITGKIKGDAGFDGGAISCPGSGSVQYDKVVVAKYDGNGNGEWAFCAEGQSNGQGSAIAVGSTGTIYVAGHFSGAFDFGGSVFTSSGGDDAFIASLRPSDGDLLWVGSHGGSADDRATAIAAGVGGQLLVAGEYASSDWTFEGIAMGRPRLGDLFFLSFAP